MSVIHSANSNLAANTLTTQAEQKLKLEKRAEHLKSLAALCVNDLQAKESYESELAGLRAMYRKILPDAEIIRRTEHLQEIREKHNLFTRDNRQRYQQKANQAVNALCGGAV